MLRNKVFLKLMDYYEDTDRLDRMLAIINDLPPSSHQSTGSQPIMQKHFTVLTLPNGERFKVYGEYKNALGHILSANLILSVVGRELPSHTKKIRRSRLPLVSELLRWAFDNGVIAYIEENEAEIEADMNTRNSSSRRNRTPTDSTKPEETSGTLGVNEASAREC